MTSRRIHEDFQDAYLANLHEITASYRFDIAPRGQASLETLGVDLKIKNPIQRVCQVPARKTNIVFNFAEALWYLSGSNLTDTIAYYAPSLRRYSADGKVLHGTAYGPRLFASCGVDGPSQWDRVVEILANEDPDTKRAAITIFDPDEDISLRNIDVSCTMCLQFLLRSGHLHLVVFMRANDAYRGMVSDVFSFTFLQEVMARQLGVPIGEYHHMVGSMHLYKADLPRATQVLASAAAPPLHQFPEMPPGDNWPHIRRVLRAERSIREGPSSFDLAPWQRELPAYWYQVVLLLLLFRTAVKDRLHVANVLEQLYPIYRDLVTVRWPQLAT